MNLVDDRVEMRVYISRMHVQKRNESFDTQGAAHH